MNRRQNMGEFETVAEGREREEEAVYGGRHGKLETTAGGRPSTLASAVLKNHRVHRANKKDGW